MKAFHSSTSQTMTIRLLTLLSLTTLAASIHAQPITTTTMGANRQLTQVSTINALIAGGLDGSVSFGELRKAGNFGIGTVDKLDGEMIMIDNQIFRIDANGKTHLVPDTLTTPFASVTKFLPDEHHTLAKTTTYDELQAELDQRLPSLNYFYALRIQGHFSTMKVRSVARQTKPYRPLTVIVNEQSMFDLPDTSGTLVGFRCPDYVQGVNVAKYHLHFISADKTHGGHVLDFTLTSGQAAIDNLSEFRMLLPEDDNFKQMNLSERNDAAVHKVERLKETPPNPN